VSRQVIGCPFHGNRACPRSDRESTCPRRLGPGNHRLKSAEKACGLRRPLCWEDLVWQPHCAASPPWARCACLPRHLTRRGTGRPVWRNTSRLRRNSGLPPPRRSRPSQQIKLQPTKTIVSPSPKSSRGGRKPSPSGENRLFRENLRALHRTSMNPAVRRISRRRGSASTG
jgi:hypothetical protein